MIIDAHTHTYPETIAKRAIEKLEKNSGTKAHTNGVQSGLMASMKEAGISYSLLLPVATSKSRNKCKGFRDRASFVWRNSSGDRECFGSIKPYQSTWA